MEINLAIIDFNPGQGGGVKPSGVLDISENGVYDVYKYSSASVDVHPSTSLSETYISNGSYNITGEFNGGVITVDVPAPEFVTETLNVSSNGTYTPSEGIDGYSQVVVDVPIDGWDQKSLTEGTNEITNLDNSASFVTSNAFRGNTNIQTVNLPYATRVNQYAFQNCNSLSQISLPVCNFIDFCTFQSCPSLTQASLPMCSFIVDYAFQYCSLLSQVSLPMCNHIGNSVFEECSLSQVSLPMCNFIGAYAFWGCSSLSIITIGYSGICSLNNSETFYATQITSSTGSIYVPASLVDSYKSAEKWSYFSTQIFPIE